MIVHLSQANLGEIKKDTGKEPVNVFVSVKGKKLVLCILSLEKFPQQPFDLVFDRDFEPSHNLKSGSVTFFGYKARNPVDDDDESHDSESDSDSESSEDDIAALTVQNNGKSELKPKEEKTTDAKRSDDNKDSAPKKKGKEAIIKSEDNDSDDSMSDDEGTDTDEDDDDDSESEDDSSEEEKPAKVESEKKKRPSYSSPKSPAANKKLKLATPQTTDGSCGGASSVATISKQKTPMFGGLSHPCKSSRSGFSGTSIVAVWGGNKGAIAVESRKSGNDKGIITVTSNAYDKFIRAHQKVYMVGTGEVDSLEKVKIGLKSKDKNLLVAAQKMWDVAVIVCQSATRTLCNVNPLTKRDLEFAIVGQVGRSGGCFRISWSERYDKFWAAQVPDYKFLTLGTGKPLMYNYLYDNPNRGPMLAEGEELDAYYLRCCYTAIEYAVKNQQQPGTSGGLVRVAIIKPDFPTPIIHPYLDMAGKEYGYQEELVYHDDDWLLNKEDERYADLLKRCGKLVGMQKCSIFLSDSDEEIEGVKKRSKEARRDAKIDAELKRYSSDPRMRSHFADYNKKRSYDSELITPAASKKARLPTSSNRNIRGGQHPWNGGTQTFGSKDGLDSNKKAKHGPAGRRLRVALE